MKSSNICIFVDHQNAGVRVSREDCFLSRLILRTKALGRIVDFLVYGSFAEKTVQKLQHSWQNYGVRYIPIDSKEKNALDRHLICDCLHAATFKQIKCVILVGGDGDYYPLIKNLKNSGIHTIVYAKPGSVSRKIQAIADEFYLIDSLLGVA